MEDGTTRTGSVNAVQRIGNTVRRQTGHWTPNVHALLRHLEANGFDRAPRVSGIDEYGREILSYVPGRVALKPWPPEMRHNDGIGELAAWLREYHEIVRDFVPPEPDTWRVPGSIWKAGCIVRHGDLGPGTSRRRNRLGSGRTRSRTRRYRPTGVVHRPPAWKRVCRNSRRFCHDRPARTPPNPVPNTRPAT